MSYSGGRTHLSQRDKTLRKAVKVRDIKILLWQLVQDCFEDLEISQEPRHGEQLMKFAIQQLALLESKTKKDTKGDTPKIEKLKEWLDE